MLYLILFLIGSLWAENVETIQFQGVLKNVPENKKNIDMQFSLFNSSTGGKLYWEEMQSVEVHNGVFNVNLGSDNGLQDVDFRKQMWLEVLVDGEAAFNTRIQMNSSAHSFASNMVYGRIKYGTKIDDGIVVKKINGLSDNIQLKTGKKLFIRQEGNTLKFGMEDAGDIYVKVEGDTTGILSDDRFNIVNDTLIDILDESLVTSKYKDRSITTDKLADDVVVSSKIKDGEVKTSDVADQNITTAKVADDAIDKDKINADVAGLGLGQNVDGSLETNVDDFTIEVSADTLQVKDLGIVTAKLADDAVLSGKIKDGEVKTSDVADQNITTAKVADDAIDKDKVNADVAGLGLGQNLDGSLETNVDDFTIEVSADTLQVKDLGIVTAKLADDAVLSGKIMDGEVKTSDVADQNITTAKIANDAVDKDKVNADVAGLGLGQNVDGSLETNVDEFTIEISADTLQVKDLGIVTAKLADDAVLSGKIMDGEVKTSDLADQNITTVKIADNAVDKDKVNADVAGLGLGQNVDGSLKPM
jgi:uncharacterized Zn finger protein